MRPLVAVLCVAFILAGSSAPASARKTFGITQAAVPAIAHKQLAVGEYAEYLPRQAPRGILVLAHGSVEEEQSGPDLRKLAETFVRRWTRFADDHGLIVVAPVFDHNFGSWIMEPGILLGGYRSLEGKEIGADEFVQRIVDQYRDRIGGSGRFYLYGHSAGGQFAARYVVRHPDRVIALVISAAGRYALPDPNVPWPFGEKEVTARKGALAHKIHPDPDGWRKAAALPITVVVGLADTERQPPAPGNLGTTRIDYARQWVEAMSRIAPEGNARIRLITVPGIGHSSAGLTPQSQTALAGYLGEP